MGDLLIFNPWITFTFVLHARGSTSPSHTHPLVLNTFLILHFFVNIVRDYAYLNLHKVPGVPQKHAFINVFIEVPKVLQKSSPSPQFDIIVPFAPLDDNPEWNPAQASYMFVCKHWL